jgi:CheY-like chemotaxis protein
MPEKIRIVLLDDSAMSLRFARAYLEGLNFDVRTATSITEFHRLVGEFPPQVILTDVEMPEATGDEICRVLRRNVATAKIPIVFFSGLDAAELSQRAQRAGADGYVCKTAGPAALQEKLSVLLANLH